MNTINQTIIYSLIIVVVYALAFGLGHLRDQKVTVYYIFLAAQVLVLLPLLAKHRDMYLGIAIASIEVVLTATVLFIVISRQISGNLLVQAGIVVAALAASYFFVCTDFRMTFLSLTSTDEIKLELKNGVMYTSQGKPFSGTAMYTGVLETYPSVVTGQEPDGREYTTREGVRVTRYENGLKEGAQKLYYTKAGFYANTRRSSLHCISIYKQGLKHGTEIVNFEGGESRRAENQFANGLLNGISKEYGWIYESSLDQLRTGKNIGPLILEKEYKNGEEWGIHRTYSEYGPKGAKLGRLDEDYVVENGKVVSGRKKTVMRGYGKAEDLTCWEFYENGQLIKKEFYAGRAYEATGFPYSEGQYLLSSEIIYENGIVIEESDYNLRNGKVKRHAIMHNGVLTEVFNKAKGIDRLAEFGIESE